jgi:hypothetical protein
VSSNYFSCFHAAPSKATKLTANISGFQIYMLVGCVMDNTNSRRNSFASPVPAYYLQQNILEISNPLHELVTFLIVITCKSLLLSSVIVLWWCVSTSRWSINFLLPQFCTNNEICKNLIYPYLFYIFRSYIYTLSGVKLDSNNTY